VVVHCMGGVSRTGCFVWCCLKQIYGLPTSGCTQAMTKEQMYSMITVRPTARGTPNQEAFADKYAEQCLKPIVRSNQDYPVSRHQPVPQRRPAGNISWPQPASRPRKHRKQSRNADLIQRHVQKRFRQLASKMQANHAMRVVIPSDNDKSGMPTRAIAATHTLGKGLAKMQWGNNRHSDWQGTVDVITDEVETLLSKFGPARVLFGSVGSKIPTTQPWKGLYQGKPSRNLFHVWGANDRNWLPRAAKQGKNGVLVGGQAGCFNHNDLVVDVNPGHFARKSDNPLPVFGIVTTPCEGTANLSADLKA